MNKSARREAADALRLDNAIAVDRFPNVVRVVFCRLQPDITILATAFSAPDQRGTGKDEPMVIVTQFGKGHGFTLVLGHDVQAMRSQGFKTLLLRGTEWAATGAISDSKPIAPSQRSKPNIP